MSAFSTKIFNKLCSNKVFSLTLHPIVTQISTLVLKIFIYLPIDKVAILCYPQLIITIIKNNNLIKEIIVLLIIKRKEINKEKKSRYTPWDLSL
jgi:hypothetical protein